MKPGTNRIPRPFYHMMDDLKSIRRRVKFTSGAILMILMTLLTYAIAESEDIAGSKEKIMTYNKLTLEEERVIVHKGTEVSFSGKYNDHKQIGTYICQQCNAPLYRSEDKFSLGCGWPSFDDEIPGAVKHQPDTDGNRTEIVCVSCEGNLGHVFLREGFTPKNTRHCVNSISLVFVPVETSRGVEKAYFAGGCFWGIEHLLRQQEGVLETEVGYMGGVAENPSYREVCAGQTGHTETVEITFDPSVTSFETLARFFFEIHDPTQSNCQGLDVGPQYRSAVLVTSDEQEKVTLELITILKEKGFDVVTEVVPAGEFWPAEEYHQDYYEDTGKMPYCHFYQKRF